jgi:hypothetical protein
MSKTHSLDMVSELKINVGLTNSFLFQVFSAANLSRLNRETALMFPIVQATPRRTSFIRA